jgi:hypothetical protein
MRRRIAQFVEQDPCIVHIGGLKALGKPAIRVRSRTSCVPRPHSRDSAVILDGMMKLAPRSPRSTTCHFDSLPETLLSLGLGLNSGGTSLPPSCQCAHEAMTLRLVPPLAGFRHRRERLTRRLQGLREVYRNIVGLG